MGLVLRNDKGSALTFTEMDNNLLMLQDKASEFKVSAGGLVIDDTWTQKTSSSGKRNGHSVVHYNDGTYDLMVVFGGYNGNNYLNDVWTYNITTDSWAQQTSGATAGTLHTAIYYNDGTNDLMVVFGGYDGNNFLNDVWEYNITADSWTQKTSGATARDYHSAIYYNDGTNDLMVVVGGYDGNNVINDVWEYNITTDTWTQKNNWSLRSGHSAVYYNDGTKDKMVVFGGYDGNNVINDVWEYNISTDTWTQKTSGATARYSHSTIYYNNGTYDLMIVYGGTYNGSDLNDIWEYNINVDSWTQKTSGATARETTSMIYYNDGANKLIIYGGWSASNSNQLNDVWQYNISHIATEGYISSDNILNKSSKKGNSLTDVLENYGDNILVGRWSSSDTATNYNSASIVKWDTHTLRNKNYTDTSASRKTVAKAGIYEVTAFITFQANSNGNTIGLKILLNGNSIGVYGIIGYLPDNGGNATYASASVTDLLNLNDNDYIEIQTVPISGSDTINLVDNSSVLTIKKVM